MSKERSRGRQPMLFSPNDVQEQKSNRTSGKRKVLNKQIKCFRLKDPQVKQQFQTKVKESVKCIEGDEYIEDTWGNLKQAILKVVEESSFNFKNIK